MNHNDGHFSRLFYLFSTLTYSWVLGGSIDIYWPASVFNGASKIGHVLLCTHQRCDPQHTHQLVSSTKTGKVAEVNEGPKRMSRKYVTPFHPYRWTIWNGHELGSTMVCMIYIYICIYLFNCISWFWDKARWNSKVNCAWQLSRKWTPWIQL